MPLNLPGALVDCDWLSRYLHHPDLVLLDASWHMPDAGRDPLREWQRCRIDNSAFFDIDKTFADSHSKLPHMLPKVDKFQESARRLGIQKESAIVVYDTVGVFSSPRAWWMFKAMGHDSVAVLNGGLPAWQLTNSVTTGVPPMNWERGGFVAELNEQWLAGTEKVTCYLQNQGLVLDARSRERFRGEQPEPRPGLRSGHMPGAYNLPFQELLADGRYKPMSELRPLFSELSEGCNGIVASCGSGVTACIIALAAHLAGCNNVSVYDGSWAEWGGRDDLPVVTG